jgi:hypothetical protein
MVGHKNNQASLKLIMKGRFQLLEAPFSIGQSDVILKLS